MTAPREVTAVNWAHASDNKIHDDTVARRFGFTGGLVPGVAVFAYMTNPVVAAYGRGWLADGRLRARFASPVYDGERVAVAMDGAGAVTVTNPAGVVCATGTADRGACPTADLDVPVGEVPAERPDAAPENLQPGTVLGTLRHGFHAETAGAYLDSIGEDLALYRDEAVAHPGWLVLDANNVLVSSRRLGPWIHVGSDAHYLRAVTDGQDLEVRARVADHYERKGHRFVDLDVVTYADGAPAMYVRHTAIYRPRQVAEAER